MSYRSSPSFAAGGKTLFERMAEAQRLPDKIAASQPKLARGQVWCRSCGAMRRVDSAQCLRSGWPKCCDATMTIDAPGERG